MLTSARRALLLSSLSSISYSLIPYLYSMTVISTLFHISQALPPFTPLLCILILQSQDPSDTVSHSEGHFGQCIKTEGPLHAGLTNELKGWSAARPMKIPFLLLALSSHSAPVPGTLSRNSSHLPRDIPDLLRPRWFSFLCLPPCSQF